MAESTPRDKGVSKRPRLLDHIGAGGMEESEARDFAYQLVRHAREDTDGRGTESPAPDPDAVRERREARQHSHDTP